MAGFTADKLDTHNAFYQQLFGEEQRRNTALIDNTKRVFGATSENLKEGAEMNINIACEFTHSCVQIKTKVGMPSGTTGKMGSTFASSSSTTLGKTRTNLRGRSNPRMSDWRNVKTTIPPLIFDMPIGLEVLSVSDLSSNITGRTGGFFST